MSAIISEADEETIEALRIYGMHLGTAFQLIDDVMDYTSEADDMGKNVGDDLAEGKPTLPLLYAMWNSDGEKQQEIRDAIENGNGIDKLDSILATMQQTGSLDYAREKAELEADKAISALTSLADSEYKQALIALADIAVHRTA